MPSNSVSSVCSMMPEAKKIVNPGQVHPSAVSRQADQLFYLRGKSDASLMGEIVLEGLDAEAIARR